MTRKTSQASRSPSVTSGALDIECAPRWLLLVGQASCLVAVLAAPWFFGCVRYREQVWLYGLMSASFVIACVVVGVRTLKTPGSGSLRIPWLALPMFAVIALGAIQLMPIEQALTGSRVTQSTELSEFDLGDSIRSDRLSFYPLATKREIVRYSFGIAAFLIGYTVFRRPGSQRGLWGLLLINGLALVIFGLIQQATWDGKLFRFVTLRQGGHPFASFVNRNNFVAYLHIAMACGVGLFVWSLERTPARASHGVLSAVMARISSIDALQIVLSLGLVVLAVGAVASESRGGAVAGGAGFLLTVVFTAFRRRSVWPFVISGVVLAIGAGVVVAMEVDTALRDRFSQLEVTEEAVNDRLRVRHWKDAVGVVKQLPALGSGLGTHRYAHLPFLTEAGRPWAVNADNQYVELAVEGGATGLLVLIVALVLAARLVWAGRDCSIESAGTATAVLFLVVAQAVHAVFDFGVIMPATLSACGLLLGAACASIGARTGGRAVSLWAGRAGLGTITVALCTICVSGLITTATARDAKDILARAATPTEISDGELDELITQVAALPDAETHLKAAELLVERVERVSADRVKADAPTMDADQIRTLASLRQLSIAVQQLTRSGYREQVQATLASDEVQEDLRNAYDQVRMALQACPILPRCEALAGRLASAMGDETTANKHYRRAVLLNPYNSATTRRAGMNMYAGGSNRDLSVAMLRQSLSTKDGRSSEKTVRLLNHHFGLSGVIDQVVPGTCVGAIRLSESLRRTGFTQYREPVLRLGLVRKSNAQDPSALIAKAEIHRLLGEEHLAVEKLREAVSTFPKYAEVHYQLARALMQNEQTSDALLEARAAVGLDPENEVYRNFLQELTEVAYGKRAGLGTGFAYSLKSTLT